MRPFKCSVGGQGKKQPPAADGPPEDAVVEKEVRVGG